MPPFQFTSPFNLIIPSSLAFIYSIKEEISHFLEKLCSFTVMLFFFLPLASNLRFPNLLPLLYPLVNVQIWKKFLDREVKRVSHVGVAFIFRRI